MVPIEKYRESGFCQALLITAVALAVFWLGPASVYERNDDVYYGLIFSGKLLTSAPDAHVVLINFVLSTAFAKLYAFFPAIPWYGAFHVVSIGASLFFLNYVYGLARRDKLIPRLVISLAGALPFLFFIQFTKTALVLGVTGYLGCYLLQDVPCRSRRQSWLLHAGAGLFLVLSFCLRMESFLLATFLCGLSLVAPLMKKNRALIVTLTVAAACILTFAVIHRQSYGPEWQRFFVLRDLAVPMIDYGHYGYAVNQQVYNAAGLSNNDYNFFMSWGYIDSKVYSQERVQYIVRNAQQTEEDRALLPALKNACSAPAASYLALVAGLSLGLLFAYRQNYPLLGLGVLLPLLLCAAVLVWQGRFPTRVSTAMAYFLPWAVLVHSGAVRRRGLVGVGALLGLAALIVFGYGQARDLSIWRQNGLARNEELHRLGRMTASAPIMLVTLGNSFPYEGILPFEATDYLSGIRFVWLSSMNQSPLQQKQLKDNRVEDIFVALQNDGSTYVATGPVQAAILRQYILEHYQRLVGLSPAYIGSGLPIYRLIN